jgi:hypothetical protein
MTTNSFGTALPRFDFAQSAPALPKYAKVARIAKGVPLAVVAAAGFGMSWLAQL